MLPVSRYPSEWILLFRPYGLAARVTYLWILLFRPWPLAASGVTCVSGFSFLGPGHWLPPVLSVQVDFAF